jgi:hypothetical protein
MPAPDQLGVADFLRLQSLVVVHRGDAEAWVAASDDEAEERLARRTRAQLRSEPEMLAELRELFGGTSWWNAASG